jgi:DNA-binding transcriptional MerR regulator
VATLARQAGVSGDTVRYYERAGLLAAPARSAAGYRLYSPAALDRLRFIQGAQRLGLRLAEIRELLAVRDTGTCPCEPAETMLRRRIGEIDTELARLAALRTDLVTMADQLPGPRARHLVPARHHPGGKEVNPMRKLCPCCGDPTCECCCGGGCC